VAISGLGLRYFLNLCDWYALQTGVLWTWYCDD